MLEKLSGVKQGTELESADAHQAAEATRKMLSQITPAVVGIETEKSTGTGFFADSSGMVVTAAHVVLNSQEVSVIDRKSNKFPAKIVQLDDVHDLAILQIENPRLLQAQPIKLGSSRQLKSGEKVSAFGYSGSNIFADTIDGKYIGSSTPLQVFAKYGGKDLETLKSSSRLLPEDSKQYLNRNVVEFKAETFKGWSGGPIVDSRGLVVAIDEGGNQKGLAYGVPVEDVNSALNQSGKRGKYNFNYTYEPSPLFTSVNEHFKKEPSQTLALGSIVLGASAFGLRMASKTPHLLGEPLGLFSVGMIWSDLTNWQRATDMRNKWNYGLASCSDALGLAGSALSFVPKGKNLANGLMAGAGLLRLGAAAIPSRLVLKKTTRIDGSSKSPVDSHNL